MRISLYISLSLDIFKTLLEVKEIHLRSFIKIVPLAKKSVGSHFPLKSSSLHARKHSNGYLFYFYFIST